MPRADVSADELQLSESDGSDIDCTHQMASRSSYRLAMPGRHIAENALAVAAALDAVGAPLDKALAALAEIAPPPGRGARTALGDPRRRNAADR